MARWICCFTRVVGLDGRRLFRQSTADARAELLQRHRRGLADGVARIVEAPAERRHRGVVVGRAEGEGGVRANAEVVGLSRRRRIPEAVGEELDAAVGVRERRRDHHQRGRRGGSGGRASPSFRGYHGPRVHRAFWRAPATILAASIATLATLAAPPGVRAFAAPTASSAEPSAPAWGPSRGPAQGLGQRVHVKGTARIDAHAARASGKLVVSGTVVDDTARPIPGARDRRRRLARPRRAAGRAGDLLRARGVAGAMLGRRRTPGARSGGPPPHPDRRRGPLLRSPLAAGRPLRRAPRVARDRARRRRADSISRSTWPSSR